MSAGADAVRATVAQLLAGEVAPPAEVTVEAWVRTRRDSKAGLSFVHVSDGSCLDPIQVVVPDSLANYRDEVLHLTAGCSVRVSGMLVESQGRG